MFVASRGSFTMENQKLSIAFTTPWRSRSRSRAWRFRRRLSSALDASSGVPSEVEAERQARRVGDGRHDVVVDDALLHEHRGAAAARRAARADRRACRRAESPGSTGPLEQRQHRIVAPSEVACGSRSSYRSRRSTAGRMCERLLLPDDVLDPARARAAHHDRAVHGLGRQDERRDGRAHRVTHQRHPRVVELRAGLGRPRAVAHVEGQAARMCAKSAYSAADSRMLSRSACALMMLNIRKSSLSFVRFRRFSCGPSTLAPAMPAIVK